MPMSVLINILISLFIEFLPNLIVLIVKSLRAPKSFNAAILGLKIAIMLAEIRGAGIADQSEMDAPQNSFDFSGKALQRLDVTDSKFKDLTLEKAKVGQFSGHKVKLDSLKASGMMGAIVDLSEAEIKQLDLRNAKINYLDLSKAMISSLNLQGAEILALDLSEVTIDAIIGMNQAHVYLIDQWKAVYKWNGNFG
jgi:uncharacterized protein YjbI with pentapeptide repeats